MYRLRQQGLLEPVKIGRATRYRESDIQAFIRERAERAAGAAS
jgi:predicted DNA-binding transcriptional regulator AlpA